MIKKTVVLLCLIFGVFNSFYAQSGNDEMFNLVKDIDRVEPSRYLIPYIKYIENRPGLANGVPDISVDLDLGLKLIYCGSGVMVGEKPSYAGLGWFVNAGGVIARVVKGLPDDAKDNGYIDYGGPNVSSATVSAVSGLDLEAIKSGAYDMEQDMFYFYTKDFMGKFVIDKDGKARTIPASNIKIEIKRDNNLKYIKEIRIIPPGSGIYIFGAAETAIIENNEKYKWFYTGWTLNAVKTHSNDAVGSVYKYVKVNHEQSVHYSKYTYPDSKGDKVTKDLTYKVKYGSCVLPKEMENGDIKIEFRYDDMTSQEISLVHAEEFKGGISGYTITPNKDAVLNKIIVNRDILRSEFTFIQKERNDYLGSTRVLDKLETSIGNYTLKEFNQTVQFNYYDFDFNGTPLEYRFIGEDLWGYPTNNRKEDILPEVSLRGKLLDPLSNSNTVLDGSRMFANHVQISGRMLRTIEIKETGLVKEYLFEPNRFTYNGKEFDGGGLRIKKKLLYSKASPDKKIVKEYLYTKPNSNETSGILNTFPYSGEVITSHPLLGNQYFHYGEYHRGLHTDGVRPVVYSCVKVITPGKGKMQYTFNHHNVSIPEYSDRKMFNSTNIASFIDISSLNYGTNIIYRGGGYYNYLHTVDQMRVDDIIIGRTTNTYTKLGKEKRALSFRTRYNALWKDVSGGGSSTVLTPDGEPLIEEIANGVGSVVYYDNISVSYAQDEIKSEVIKGGKSISTVTKQEYLTDGYYLPYKKTVTTPDGIKRVEETYYTGSYTGGDDDIYFNKKEVLNNNLESITKSNVSFNLETGTWSVNKEYTIPDTKRAFYDNLYSYSENITAREIFELKSRNDIYTPVENISYIEYPSGDRVITKASVIEYKTIDESNSIVADKVYSLRGPVKWTNERYQRSYIDDNNHFIFSTSTMKLISEVLKYGDAGNVLEVKGENGVITSMLYDDDYNVVAKGVDVRYDMLKIQREKIVKDKVYPFKSSSKHIKCYYYQKPYGKIKETDVNGNFIYYDYDVLGRLATIYDNDKNIISHKRTTINGVNVPVHNLIKLHANAGFYDDKNVKTVRWDRVVEVNERSPVYYNGKYYKENFYFTKSGNNSTVKYIVQDGNLINAIKQNYNVVEEPFRPKVKARNFFIHADATSSYSDPLPVEVANFCVFDKFGSVDIEIDTEEVGGTGRYVLKMATLKYDKNNPEPINLTPTYSTRDMKSMGDNTDYRYRITSPGNHIVYIWIYDKLKTVNIPDKPDPSTAHYTYKFQVSYTGNSLPNPINN